MGEAHFSPLSHIQLWERVRVRVLIHFKLNAPSRFDESQGELLFPFIRAGIEPVPFAVDDGWRLGNATPLSAVLQSM